MKWILFWKRPKTIASITSSLSKMVEQLRTHADDQAKAAEAAGDAGAEPAADTRAEASE